jgi:hypothetical protein
LPLRQRHTTFDREAVPEQARAMTNTEYLILISIAPLGALLIAGMLFYFTRDTPKHPHPGE